MMPTITKAATPTPEERPAIWAVDKPLSPVCSGTKFDPTSVIVGAGVGAEPVTDIIISIVRVMLSSEMTIDVGTIPTAEVDELGVKVAGAAF